MKEKDRTTYIVALHLRQKRKFIHYYVIMTLIETVAKSPKMMEALNNYHNPQDQLRQRQQNHHPVASHLKRSRVTLSLVLLHLNPCHQKDGNQAQLLMQPLQQE